MRFLPRQWHESKPAIVGNDVHAQKTVTCRIAFHTLGEFTDAPWTRRIRGLRCNASRKSHAELDASETLDDGNPDELARQYADIKARMPWLNVFGGCCGSDLRHVTETLSRMDMERYTKADAARDMPAREPG